MSDVLGDQCRASLLHKQHKQHKQHNRKSFKVWGAARLLDIKAHVTYRVVGMEHRWTVSLWDESRIRDPGD